MIKPITQSIVQNNNQAVVNLMASSTPLVYETSMNYSPVGKNLDVSTFKCRKPCLTSSKIDYFA